MSEQQDPMRRMFKPMADLMVINAETSGTMFLRQNALMSELVEEGVETLRKALTASNMQDAFEVQRDYARVVGEKLQNVTRENMETLRDAGASSQDVMRNAFASQAEAASDAVANAADAASSAAANVAEAASA